MNISFKLLENIYKLRALLFNIILITSINYVTIVLIDYLEVQYINRAENLLHSLIILSTIFHYTFIRLGFEHDLIANIKNLIFFWIIFFFGFLIYLFLFKLTGSYSRTFIASFFVINMFLNISLYYIFKKAIQLLNLRNTEKIILIGKHNLKENFEEIIDSNKSYEIYASYENYKLIESNKIPNISKVIVFLSYLDMETISKIEKIFKNNCCDILINVKNRRDNSFGSNPITNLFKEKFYVFNNKSNPNKRFSLFFKRLFDFTISILALTTITPFLLLIALIIKSTSKGPIIYKQKRNGYYGKEFHIYKFRTMYFDENDYFFQAKKDDKRITKIGSFLRKTSIDELPQLLNIIIGDMSLVGPRPHETSQNLSYSSKIEDYMYRHRMKPGITGLAQINGMRGETSTITKMERRIKYDIEYIENWSILYDFKILALTPISLIKHSAF